MKKIIILGIIIMMLFVTGCGKKDAADIIKELDKKMKLQKLQTLLPGSLTPRENEIIELRYGLGGKKELTQREIAKKMGISRSYVSRIEKSALEKLRKHF